jgi:hypothetical protein
MTRGNEDDEAQADTFEKLYEKICAYLGRFGEHDSLLGPGDYSVYGGYWGHPQVKVSVNNLEILRPSVVEGLQAILKKFPGWEIVVAVAVRGHYYDWPEMGLIVRQREIVDGLQRQYFPPALQDIRYRGSRPGTDRD